MKVSKSKGRREAVNDCKEIQGLIPRYLRGELTLHEARLFTKHLKRCDDCREEIEISYLLDQGIVRVENGETIDLHADLEDMLRETEDSITHLTQFRTAVYLIESTAIFVLIACVLILTLF
ncbi:MAG: zf-HC2 domain-containing protein [Lachnospiraceae bacterium]|nr:zf-HC2 domain-containing protein [Lachnospiraceae bacterium]